MSEHKALTRLQRFCAALIFSFLGTDHCQDSLRHCDAVRDRADHQRRRPSDIRLARWRAAMIEAQIAMVDAKPLRKRSSASLALALLISPITGL